MQTLNQQSSLLGAIKSLSIPCVDTQLFKFSNESYHIVDIYEHMLVFTSDFSFEQLGEDGYEEIEAFDKTVMLNINGIQQTYDILHERDKVVVYSSNLQWEAFFAEPEEARDFFNLMIDWCKGTLK